jgi:cephalosporin-C deacetylase-like acetyl esterase
MNQYPAANPLLVCVEADRNKGRYLNNEKAAFTIKVYCNNLLVNHGEVEVWLSKDGGPLVVEKKKFDLSEQNPFQVIGTVDEPAFLLCQAWAYVDDEKAYGEKMVWFRSLEDTSQLKIELIPDRQNALYRCGELAEFTARVTQQGKQVTDGKLELRLSREGIDASVARRVFDLGKDKTLKLSGTLTDAAFLYCQATLIRDADKSNPQSAWISVGYDVERIVPETAMPEDFKAFWEKIMDNVRQLPMDVKLEKIEKLSSAKAAYYHFSVNTLNNERVYGFLGIPSGPGPFPAIALYPGAGPGYGTPVDLGLTSCGVITLVMNVHKYPVAESPDEAQQQLDNYITSHHVSNYFSAGISSRETFHFYTILPGFCRALDYICARSDWDGKTLVIEGSSQGGFLTLAISSLFADKVSFAISGVPSCDFNRSCQVRNWPTGAAREYYDAVNFARFIRCPVQMNVALIDSACQPGSVFSAYNAILGKDKKIRIEPRDGHGTTPERQAMERECIIRGLGLRSI